MTATRRTWSIAGLLVLGGLILIVLNVVPSFIPRDISKEDPRRVFRSFICDPIPPSVSNVKAHGILAFAGGHVVVDFEIENRDREQLLKQGGFQSPGKQGTEWVDQGDPFGDDGGSLSFLRPDEGMSQTALYLANCSSRARFHLISY